METWMSKRLLAKKKNRQRTPVLRPQTLAQSDKTFVNNKSTLDISMFAINKIHKFEKTSEIF